MLSKAKMLITIDYRFFEIQTNVLYGNANCFVNRATLAVFDYSNESMDMNEHVSIEEVNI